MALMNNGAVFGKALKGTIQGRLQGILIGGKAWDE